MRREAQAALSGSRIKPPALPEVLTRVEPYCDGAHVVSGTLNVAGTFPQKRPACACWSGVRTGELASVARQDRAVHHSAVVVPVEANPRAVVPPPILNVCRLLECLVVIDSKDSGWRSIVENQPNDARGKETVA